MNKSIDSIFLIPKRPSAWIPIAIPVVFFVYLIVYIAIFGIVREKDEGTAAHLFQLWLVLELLMIAFFAFKWLPRAPKQATIILLLQIATAFLPISIVFGLNL